MTALTANCPKCSFVAPTEFSECPACGVVVAKFARRQGSERAVRRPPTPTPLTPAEPPSPVAGAAPSHSRNDQGEGSTVAAGGTLYDPSQHAPTDEGDVAAPPLRAASERERLTLSRRKAIKLGVAVGAIVFLFPLTRFIFSYLLIIVHELGHTAFALLFGIPAVPALDFMFGGGVSLMWDRSILLTLCVIGGGLALLWRVRCDSRALAIGGGVALFWTLAMVTPLHDVMILAMGHGAELLFAGYAWHKCLTGNCRSETERWLFGACSVFVLLSAWTFGYKLLASSLFRRQYEQAKGGGHWMDFSRIAEQHLHVDLSIVAATFWLLTALTPVVAYWIWLNTDGR